MKIKAIAKRWGNSFAVILPKEVVDQQGIYENEELILEVKKPLLTREAFDMLKGWRKSGQRIKDEARRGWESAFKKPAWK